MPSRRSVIGLLAGVASGCTAPVAGRDPNGGIPTRLVRRAEAAARRVRPAVVVLQPPEAADSGTAWFLADGRLVTAGHVVEMLGDPLRVTTVAGRTGRATVEGRWPDVDLAVLSTDMDPPASLALKDEEGVAEGDPAIQVGHTRAGYWSVTVGRVERIANYQRRSLVLTGLDVMRGNSGSPLLSIDGEAIGLTVGTVPRPEAPPREAPTPGSVTVYERYPRRSVRYGAHLAPSTLRGYLEPGT